MARTPRNDWTNDDVLRVYNEYPRKVGRKLALRRIATALTEIAEREADPVSWLVARVRQYAESPAGKRGKFTPYPATWFNQGRYDDDPTEWADKDQPTNPTPGRIVAPRGKYDGL